MSETENQFSLTRAASKPAAWQKNQIPISRIYELTGGKFLVKSRGKTPMNCSICSSPICDDQKSYLEKFVVAEKLSEFTTGQFDWTVTFKSYRFLAQKNVPICRQCVNREYRKTVLIVAGLLLLAALLWIPFLVCEKKTSEPTTEVFSVQNAIMTSAVLGGMAGFFGVMFGIIGICGGKSSASEELAKKHLHETFPERKIELFSESGWEELRKKQEAG